MTVAPAIASRFKGHIQGETSTVHRRVMPWLLALFIVSLAFGVSFEVVGQRLTPTRLVLVTAFFPLLVQLVSGKLGKIRKADYLIFFLCLWIVVSLLYNEGVSRLMFSLVSSIETLGAYLLGRFLIRNLDDFLAMVRWHLIILVIMMPFAVIEFTTGMQIWARVLDIFGDVEYRGASSEPRFGFNRVLVGFEHPILYGIFCSMAAATSILILRGSFLLQGAKLAFVAFMTFMSLSSGALIAVGIQGGLIAWGIITRDRWMILFALMIGLFIFAELASNRGAVIIFIETLAFDRSTAWTRIIQWEYGTAEVMRHPIFGKGLDGDWVRPSWLYTSSIDNYWLVVAFRHGLPAIIALLGSLALHVVSIMRTQDLPEEIAQIRTAYLIVLASLFFALATVHIWDSSVIFVFFYIGAGAWINDMGGRDQRSPAMEALVPGGRPINRYSRFAPTAFARDTTNNPHTDGGNR